MKVRGADTIVAQGRKRKARNAGFFASLEKQYGVPAGVILAIHGMETGFGGFMGDSAVVSAITTLTYDCRRSDFFKPHAIGALKLVDQGAITASTKGAKTRRIGAHPVPAGQRAEIRGRCKRRTDAWISTIKLMRSPRPPISCAKRGGKGQRLSRGSSQLCRDQTVERGGCLPKGHRDHGRAYRRLNPLSQNKKARTMRRAFCVYRGGQSVDTFPSSAVTANRQNAPFDVKAVAFEGHFGLVGFVTVG